MPSVLQACPIIMARFFSSTSVVILFGKFIHDGYAVLLLS